MTNGKLDALIEQQFKDCHDLLHGKGKEYVPDERDALSNFKSIASQVGAAPQAVVLIFLNKHMNSITRYVKSGIEGSESIDKRITDAINYLILLRALIEDEDPSLCG